jgi:hypothetical protein
MSLMIVPSLGPGASSQPAEIRRGHGGGIGRIMWGQRHNRTGVSGLSLMGLGQSGACLSYDDEGDCLEYAPTESSYPVVTSPSNVGQTCTTVDSNGNCIAYTTTVTGPTTPSTVGSTPAQTIAALNPAAAINALNQTLALSQGGSVLTSPSGATTILGSSQAAASAASTAALLANPTANILNEMMPLLLIGGALMIFSSMGKH